MANTKNAGKENCTIVLAFFKHYFLLLANKKSWGGRFFSANKKNRRGRFFSDKPSTLIFFICLYFIGTGGDENPKIYLPWPYLKIHPQINPVFYVLLTIFAFPLTLNTVK